jgi:hypothetical protein
MVPGTYTMVPGTDMMVPGTYTMAPVTYMMVTGIFKSTKYYNVCYKILCSTFSIEYSKNK